MSLGLDSLTTVEGSIEIYNNVVLPTCEAENLIAQLTVFTGATKISGNDDTGTCE